MFLAGLGLKFPTGEHDIRDWYLFNYDHGKNITGEYDKSAGIIPAEFQIGTGTPDIMASVYYKFNVRDYPVKLKATYVHPCGENSYGYEIKDRYSFSSGTSIDIWKNDKEDKLSLDAGLSAIWIPNEDVNHSEDTTLLRSQEIGRVDGTDGTFLFFDAGLTWKATDWLSGSLSTKWPLKTGGDSTEHAIDYQVILSLTLKF